MKEYKISIIVPVYNFQHLLNKCIKSIISQTYENLEIILVNDGSKDNSLDICMEFKKKDKRIIVIDQVNQGSAAARNRGLDAASGDFIGFVDSDDYIEPRMYEKMLNALIDKEADIAECGYYTTDVKYNILGKHPMKNEIIEGNYNCSYNSVKGENTTNFNFTKLYSKKIFENLRYPNLRFSEDYVLNIKAMYKCQRKVSIADCLYYYVRHEDSLCLSDYSPVKLDTIKAGSQIFDFHEERFADLQPLCALYILKNIMLNYCLSRSLSIIQKEEISKQLISNYKKYYPYVKNEFLKLDVKLRWRLAMRVFFFSPDLFCMLVKPLGKYK